MEMDEPTWQEIRAERMAERRQHEALLKRTAQHAVALAGIRHLEKLLGANVLKPTDKPMPTEPRLDDNDYLWHRNAELDKQRETLHKKHGFGGSLVR